MNTFEHLYFFPGSRDRLTLPQERALIRFVIRLGRNKFARYRALADVGSTPIPRLSKGEASRLLQVIIDELEVAS